MNIATQVTQLIGNTPLLELIRYQKDAGVAGRLVAKLESMNPAGSAKDRVGVAMVEAALESGQLKPGATIIEPTSGNTGIGLACAAAYYGLKIILTMPDSMSLERRSLLAAYGAQIVLTPAAEGMKGAIDKAEELARSLPGSFIPSQFDNPVNPDIHRRTTGPEIWRDTDGTVDAFVAGVGTGGTITGVGEYLKGQNPAIYVLAVEPADSPLLSQGKAGPHGLQGIGANFVPSILNTKIYDEVFPVTTEQAFAAAKKLAHLEGVLVGISSGAALHAATELARRPDFAGKTIVVLLPDTGERYLSTGLFD